MGDAYRGVWDCLIEATQLRNAAVRGLRNQGIKAEAKAKLERRSEELRHEIARRMLSILPYERPGQTADRRHPDPHICAP